MTSGKQLDRDYDIGALKALKDGEMFYFNTFEDGGSMAVKCVNVWVLFDIPQYGGQPQYVETFMSHMLNELIETGERD